MAHERLKQITTKAKQLYKSGKYKKWTDAIKAASASLPAAKKVAKKKVAKKASVKKVAGWKKGKTIIIEHNEKPLSKHKNVRVKRNPHGDMFAKPGTFKNFQTLKAVNGLHGMFDTSAIHDLDQLKKEYHKLAIRYHPDKGGTKEQFQQLQNEYEKLMKSIVNGSTLSQEQKDNEIKIDEALRKVLDAVITLPGINIEIVGKWIWVSGNTYPVKNELKASSFQFASKKKMWYYAGSESSGRGRMDIDEIRSKYGSEKVTNKNASNYLHGIDLKITSAKKKAFKTNLQKLTRLMNKRPI
jgi:DnaJ domain